ncbi:MAG: CAP domain-containing protein [Acidobacteriota bacterium]|nr:CAP domain-containing protein [Acidobacteriota bacterium]
MRIAALCFAALLLPAQEPAPVPGRATAFERAVVQELNDARVRPKAFAQQLRDLRDCFEGRLWKRPGRVALRTREGVAALDEAVSFLETVTPLKPLRFHEGLARAARLHAWDIGARGRIDHIGADGSRLSDRLNRLGTWQGHIAENISTLEEDARHVVIQLLVDDGVPGRGHRRNIFNPDLRLAGVGSAPHRDYKVVTVIDFADGFVER